MNYRKLKGVAIFLVCLIIIGLLSIIFLFLLTNQSNSYRYDFENVADNTNVNQEIGSQQQNNVSNNSTDSNASGSLIDLNELDKTYIPDYDFYFELPINGATGYASINSNIRASNSSESAIVKKINAGTGFKILEENENWLKVDVNGTVGWISTLYCMVNLPDIIPSIVYDDTNSYSSLFKSSEIDIPNVTGKQLYNNKAYNERLEKNEYMMPVIYAMAKKIMKAQELALEEGYSLKIYETYRPYEAQVAVSTNLNKLMNENKTVYNGINGGGWNEGWFIAQVLSNHQRGIAMDVSLVKVNNYKVKTCGNYKYMSITDYTEEQMPTQMHELSNKAISMKYGVDSNSKTAWEDVPMASGMTDGAKRLRNYCVEAGLTPLCSEWWHFNDLDARKKIGNNYSTGRYYITECCSAIPE